MSTMTQHLDLFKYDPQADRAQTFNIDLALNENWDKIDEAASETDAALEAHTGNAFVHMTAEERAAWNAAIAAHESRIQRLEDSLYNEITGNPHSITFAALEGLVVTGVWNEAQARLEC